MALALTSSLVPLLALNTAFVVIFGIFVVAMLTLVVIVLMWAFRRDRVGRAAWRQRQNEANAPPAPPAPGP